MLDTAFTDDTMYPSGPPMRANTLGEGMRNMNTTAMKIDAEIVHNWTQRYIHVRTGQLGMLSQDVRAALLRATMSHHRDGRDAQELALELAAQFPTKLNA